MATLSTKSRDEGNKLPIGATVLSKRVGTKGGFTGTITAYWGAHYIVTDHNGKGWHRDRDELTLLNHEVGHA